MPEPHPPFEILSPTEWTAPAVFNSPHSGREFPQDFLSQSRLTRHTLRKSEDCYVDELFLSCIAHGAPMLRARLPRSYIDLNREPYELDPRMFVGELPGYANTGSPRVAGGLGTIPRIVSEGEEIYHCRIDFAEARRRIEQVYLPYHRTLSALTNAVVAKAGEVLLVDCHSMPASASAHLAPQPSGGIDVVLGDRFGASCAEDISALVEDGLREQGLRVLRNKPYAGGFITQNHGAPHRGRHALQIEINRNLYVNEATLEKTAGFGEMSALLDKLWGSLLPYLEQRFAPRQLAAE
ncbi:MAG: N-formylglutamate amidohydrolase [Aestuariivirga sp.]|uniref:N-formylglutamate amidohydrolase n=1 Tax=Aestuariivirga sp. TaxID=2650926 RepID=UPI0025BE0E27|nr:N-formylglutamate amidohydrolase [Aestuariivirga sp.]MCA3562014.1 N-formylglutamate amidohydrolase [Aestuariivirga sp.]